jgi:hypothetical protein
MHNDLNIYIILKNKNKSSKASDGLTKGKLPLQFANHISSTNTNIQGPDPCDNFSSPTPLPLCWTNVGLKLKIVKLQRIYTVTQDGI